MSDDPSPEEIAEFSRLEKLYRGISEDDRFYIVDRWDREQELESPHRRLRYKRNAPHRKLKRNILTVLAWISVLMLLWWVSNRIQKNEEVDHASFVLEKLKEQSTGNTVVKSALDTAEAQYDEWQEEKRIESQANR